MALVVMSTPAEEKARRSSFRADRKPWMLRDYLGDDMSSCSSSGFRSFPRKQCCAAAVRNIIERKDVVIHNGKPPKRMLVRSRSISSAIQRASMAVINAVKLLPFNSTAKRSGDDKTLLCRSFSRKIFRRSLFWKNNNNKEKNNMAVKKKKNDDDHDDDEIGRWISSGVVGMEKYEPLDLSNDTTVTTTSTTSGSKSDDSSWSDDVTFTSDCSTENDVVERRENVEEEEDDVAVSKGVGEESVKPAVSEESFWYNEETEKEHSSPISVLDFPYNDEGNSSPFTLRILRFEGAQERLMKKLVRFENLEPVNLEGLLSSTNIEVPSSPKYSIQPCATPSYILSVQSDDDQDEEEDEEEEESKESELEKTAQHLLNITKTSKSLPSKIKFDELENVLLDFYRENIAHKTNDALLKMAENWLNGEFDAMILGWEVKDKRQAYIRDMEEGGLWPRDNILEREEVSSKLGDEVLVHLIEEIMVELCTS